MSELRKGEQTRQAILKRTRKLLMARGFHNTSVNQIIAACGVQKGNLYYHFASKEELGLAVLEDAAAEFFQLLEDSLAGADSLDSVGNSLEMILQAQRKANFVGGCLFGNTALEMSDSNPQFNKVIRGVFDRWVDLLADVLAQAQKQSGPLAHEPPQLAKLIVAVIEGGIMMARVSKDGRDLQDCILVLRRLLNIPAMSTNHSDHLQRP